MIRKILGIIAAICICIQPCCAIYDAEVDYMDLMIQCAAVGDWEMGQYAQFGRDAKIDAEGIDAKKISYEDLYLLGKIIYAEAGSSWLSDEWKMSVGEVVLNRVESPLFPSTVAEVIYQSGQYYGSDTQWFYEMDPDRRCILLALRLLEGERVLQNSEVLFQANFRQGSGVHTAMYDGVLGWTYFCFV